MRCTPLIKRLNAIALVMWFLLANISAAAPTSEIQALTVAFLYNFMKLSEWPDEAVGNELILCVTQARDFGHELDSISGREIQDKTLKVKQLIPGDDPLKCQLLFLPSEEKPLRMQEWLKAIENAPVLSVSDVDGFLDQGGMIALASDGNRLQFEVNLERIENLGIKMSSQILQIARAVRGK